jgi:RNA polymerase sigma factor (sigma-70 family)
MASISTTREPVARMPKRLLVLRADEGLAVRAAAGDDAAFEVLYERHVSGILSFCRHMLGSVEEAEDVAQHAFAALHAELARGAEGLHLRAWLYTVARNRCLSTLRGRRERTGRTLAPQTAGLTGEIERRADLRELLADLHDLPTAQRAALVLSELGDLSQVEVAEVLGTEAARVKGLVFRARSGLIERRDARAASCLEIRGELATAHRGALRRGRLRHHLRACPECAAYLEDVRRQRRMMALLLPVMPSVGLKRGVFAAAGLGTGAGAGAGAGPQAATSAASASGAVRRR